jgi:hypothetical protein
MREDSLTRKHPQWFPSPNLEGVIQRQELPVLAAYHAPPL